MPYNCTYRRGDLNTMPPDPNTLNLAALMMMLLPFMFFCAFGVLVLAATAFWIWMLVDCATNEPSQGNDKIIWILVIIFTHWLGALIYLLARRPERIRLYGR